DLQNSTNSPDLHVNFDLKTNGVDGVSIFVEGTVIDAITFGPQTPDVSEGRWPDGRTNLYTMAPTPHSANMVIPVITTQPENQTVPAGQAASFGVAVGGASPLSYQWFIVCPPEKPPTVIVGATNSVHTISNAQPADTCGYFAVVSNVFGVVT